MSTKEGLALLARKYNRGNGWKYGGGHFLSHKNKLLN